MDFKLSRFVISITAGYEIFSIQFKIIYTALFTMLHCLEVVFKERNNVLSFTSFISYSYRVEKTLH